MRFIHAPSLAALALCACTAEPLGPPNLVPVASVTVEPPNPVVGVGAQAALTPVPKDVNGNTLTNRVFTWATADAAIAKVDSQGVVTGIAAGSTQITATAEGKSGSVTLSVSATPVASVTVTPPTATVDVGATTTLTGSAFDAGSAPLPGRVFSWASSSPGVAVVSSLGVVRGVAPGSATITGTSEGKSATATVTVVIAPVAQVIVSPATGTVGLGQSLQLTATVKDAAGNTLTGRPVTWQSSNSQIVSVSSAGVARGLNLGDVTITATAEGVNGTAAIGARLRFSSLSAGQDFSCGVTPLGNAFCWGRNAAGALGNGSTTNRTTPGPVTMPAGVLFDSISAGQDHACAISASGAVYCWGGNASGQLGTGNTSPQTTPTLVSVPGVSVSFASVSAAAQFTCALTTGTNPTVYCWGLNSTGQLGNAIFVGTLTPNPAPLQVTGGPFRAVSATQGHACGILTTSGANVVCWGLNDAGQLGRGGGPFPPFDQNPVAITGSVTYAAVSGGFRFTCGIESGTATVDCWGLNDVGQLGTTTADPTQQSVPVAVTGSLTFSQLSTGRALTCGVTTAGLGYCWGDNTFGQLGIGGGAAVPMPPQPRAVSGNLAFALIHAGYFHACGLTTTNVAWCWGRAQDGFNLDASALGTGATSASNVPVEVSGQQ